LEKLAYRVFLFVSNNLLGCLNHFPTITGRTHAHAFKRGGDS